MDQDGHQIQGNTEVLLIRRRDSGFRGDIIAVIKLFLIVGIELSKRL